MISDNPGVIFAHLLEWKKNLSELKWFQLAAFFFFNFKEFVLGLCYLDSFKFYLFSGLWEAKGPDTDYFLTFFLSYTEESGDVGRTTALPSSRLIPGAWPRHQAPAAGNASLINEGNCCVPQESKQALRDSEAAFSSASYLNLTQPPRILVSIFLTFPAFLQINNIMH